MLGKGVYTGRVIFVVVAILLIFSYLIVHLYNLQIISHRELFEKAKKRYTSVEKSRGERGEIYDRRGNLLVGNIPSVDVRADPQQIKDKTDCRLLAGYFYRNFGVSSELIFNRLSEKEKNGRLIKEVNLINGLTLSETSALKEFIKEKKIDGVFFYDSSKRFYPKNELLSNTLGFINTDNGHITPVSGLEKAYNSILSPDKSEVSVYERSRKGVPLSYGNSKIYDPEIGSNIYLTIDEPIQAIVEEELKNLVEKWNPLSAYAVMVNPKTGSVIAMAQFPTFNPNDRSEMLPEKWQNRIIIEGFEPGSIMKPLIISKALDLGVVTPATVFDCENGLWYYGGKSLKDSHKYGELTVSEIIQKSSNIGTAKIALLLGEMRLYELLESYGFGKKSSLPFNPQATGILRKLNKWDTLSITRFPIGQGILTTPLQIVDAYVALANGGKRMRLKIVDRIQNPETGEFFYVKDKEENRIYSEKSAKETVEMMKLVTQEGGTARQAHVKGYDVAGKTGTSQKWVDGAYSKSKYYASFVGFVPADDPEFVLLVTVNEPHGGIYGGTIAAPTFTAIAERTLKYLNVPPTYPDEIK